VHLLFETGGPVAVLDLDRSRRLPAWTHRGPPAAYQRPTERLQLGVNVGAQSPLTLSAFSGPPHLLPPTLTEPAVVEYRDVTIRPKFSKQGLVERGLIARHDEQHDAFPGGRLGHGHGS
jgi:hypothetical protein